MWGCRVCLEDKFVLARGSITRDHRFEIAHERFSWNVGGGHLFWELHLPGIPYQTILLILKLWEVL